MTGVGRATADETPRCMCGMHEMCGAGNGIFWNKEAIYPGLRVFEEEKQGYFLCANMHGVMMAIVSHWHEAKKLALTW